eukprot:Skav222824  [mRNA]  locus=scaffold4760:48209:50399:- [translate_table: standard]
MMMLLKKVVDRNLASRSLRVKGRMDLEYRMPERTKVNLDAASCACMCFPIIAFRTKDTRLLPRRIFLMRVELRTFISSPASSEEESPASFSSMLVRWSSCELIRNRRSEAAVGEL